MKRTLSAVEARKKLGEILEGVFYRGDEVIIERAGKPMAVVIPARLYENIASNREELFKMIEEIHERNRDVPPDVIQAEIEETIREVRQEKQKSKKQ